MVVSVAGRLVEDGNGKEEETMPFGKNELKALFDTLLSDDVLLLGFCFSFRMLLFCGGEEIAT